MNDCVTVAGFDPTVEQGDAQPLDRARDRRKPRARSPRRSRPTSSTTRPARLYRFVWNIYCDWYLELAKPVLAGPDGAAKDETRAMVAWVRDEILKLLHPFMPFVTEELWRVTGRAGAGARRPAWRWRPGRSTRGSPTMPPKPRSAG